jgi:hypothetical protein
MTTFKTTPILGGNTTARIKLPEGSYTSECGSSQANEPNDRGVGVMLPEDSNGSKPCKKLGFVVLESNETNHYFLKRRQTTILQKNGQVDVWNDGANILEGAKKRTYESLEAWKNAANKNITEEKMEEIERIQQP